MEQNKAMENQNNGNTTLLMVIGFIFVAIAGVIFVTTTWKYIPLVGKQVILAGVTAGLFTLSHKVQRLEKTKTVLYYLGIIFLGFFSVTLFTGIEDILDIRLKKLDEWNLLLASLCMMIPAILRFSTKRSGLDLLVNILIANSISTLAIYVLDCEFDVLPFSWSVYVLLFSIADYYKEKWIDEDNTGLQKGFKVCYAVFNGIYLFLLTWMIIFPVLDEGMDLLILLVLVAASGLHYKKNNTTVMRVINSLLMVWAVSAYIEVYGISASDYDESMQHQLDFVKYVINSILAVVLMRKELFYLVYVVGNLYTYYQIGEARYYGAEYAGKLMPYLVVLAVVLLATLFRRIKQGKTTWEEQGTKIGVIAILQLATTMFTYVASYNKEFAEMLTYLHSAVFLASIGVMFAKQNFAKGMWYTFAINMSVCALVNQPFVKIPSDFEFEWGCACVALGIAAFRYVWNYKPQLASEISFIFVCLLMTVMVFYNVILGDLANVMILGITCTLMILYGAAKNNRKYTILSSIVLILIVLYISKDFWLNIEWWVYLLVAGIVMIVLAIKKERDS